MSITTLTLYTAWIPLVILLILFAWNKYVALVVLSLFSTLLLPAKLHWQPCLDGYMLKTWREYFNFSYLVEGQGLFNFPLSGLLTLYLSGLYRVRIRKGMIPMPTLCYHSGGIDPKAKYILAEFPHGAFPLGPIISMSIISECLYHKYTNGVGASILFWIPGYYHFLTWMGGVPASRSNVLKLLRKARTCVGSIIPVQTYGVTKPFLATTAGIGCCHCRRDR